MRILYLLGAIGVLGLGVAWMIANAAVVPGYGDTKEYLALSRTLQVDPYRTVLYPTVLRLCGVVQGDGPPSPGLVYAVQLAMVVVSTTLFTLALADSLGFFGARRRDTIAAVLAATALTVTNPLIAHFAFSLMTDSLASSFCMAFIGSLALAIGDGVWARSRRGVWAGVAAVCLALLASIRVEKLYVSAGLVVVAAVWLVRTRPPARAALASPRVLVVAALFVAALSAVALLNRATQIPNPRRAPLALSDLAFNRVVWPRLARVYPYLSPAAQAQIPFAAAVRFDAHNNNVARFRNELLARSPDNQRLFDEITVTTLRTFPFAVLGRTVFDVTKYALPNLAFPLECATVLPQSIATNWTLSRMSEAHSRLTRVVLVGAEAFFLIVQLPLALAAALAWRRSPRRSHPIVWLTGAVILINALLFGMGAGQDANIRYALPAYTMTHAAVVLLSLAWLYRSAGDLAALHSCVFVSWWRTNTRSDAAR